MKTLFSAIAVLACLIATPARAQNVTNTLHVHGQETIDGAKNPELVPDPIAYHLVLIHYANLAAVLPNEQDVLGPIGLSHSDSDALARILSRYKAAHEKETRALAEGQDYRSRRDAHALAAKAEIEHGLSQDGSIKFAAFVQREKARMQVPKQ
jgi:hypothetical protein